MVTRNREPLLLTSILLPTFWSSLHFSLSVGLLWCKVDTIIKKLFIYVIFITRVPELFTRLRRKSTRLRYSIQNQLNTSYNAANGGSSWFCCLLRELLKNGYRYGQHYHHVADATEEDERNQKMEEQRLAAEERHRANLQRSDERMNRMFQELHLGRAPAASHSSMDRFPTLKIDFKEFSGEPEDWNTWSRVHHAQLSALGCADALTAEGDDDIKIGAGGYEDGNYDPVKLRAAHQAWVSLMTTCKGVAFEIVQGAESPGKAWSRLVQHYRASGLKERRRLTVDFYTMKMELGEHPRKFLLRVDQMVKELERVERPVDPKDVDIVILSGLTSQYDAEVRMLESSSDWPTREWIERAVINQYDRLKSEQSAAGNHAMLAGRGNGHDSKPSPPRCPLCSRTGHTAKGCREYVVTKRDHKPNGHQGDNSKNGGNKHNKRRGEKGKSQHKDGSKLIRAGCYFCEGPHKSEDCPHRLESTAAPAESQPKHGGFIGSVRRSINSGMIASVSSGSALTANVTIERQDEV